MGFRWPWRREEEAPEPSEETAPAPPREPWDGGFWFARAGGWDDAGPIEAPKQDHVEGPPVVGKVGLHACDRLLDALDYARSGALCFVRVSGDVVSQGGQRAATERVIERMVDAERAVRDVAAKELESLLGEPLVHPKAHTEAAEARRREALDVDKRARDVAWKLERDRGERATLEGEKRGLETRILEARFEALLHEAAACVPERGLEPRVFEHLREAYAEHGEDRAAKLEARLEEKLRAAVNELPDLEPAAQPEPALPPPTPPVREVEDSWLSHDGPFRVAVALSSPLEAQAVLPRTGLSTLGPARTDAGQDAGNSEEAKGALAESRAARSSPSASSRERVLCPLLDAPDLDVLARYLQQLADQPRVVASGVLDPTGDLRDRVSRSTIPLIAVVRAPLTELTGHDWPELLPVIQITVLGDLVRADEHHRGYELEVGVRGMANRARESAHRAWNSELLRDEALVASAKWILAGEPSIVAAGWLTGDEPVVHVDGDYVAIAERLDGLLDPAFVCGSAFVSKCGIARNGELRSLSPKAAARVRSALRQRGWYRNRYHPFAYGNAATEDEGAGTACCRWCGAQFLPCPKQPIDDVGCGTCGQHALEWLGRSRPPRHANPTRARVRCENCGARFDACTNHPHAVCAKCERVVEYTEA